MGGHIQSSFVKQNSLETESLPFAAVNDLVATLVELLALATFETE
jgi:hypothetical protein